METLAEADGSRQEKLRDFLTKNNIDDNGSDEFLNTDPDIQDAVMATGAIDGARNPSAALLQRIRNAKSSVSLSIERPDEAVLEDFINRNGLDERAAAAVREAAPLSQQIVLDRGDLEDCRNPSSAILGRLRDARNNVGKAKLPSELEHIDIEDFIIKHELDERAQTTLREAVPALQQHVLQRGFPLDCRNPSAVLLSRIKEAFRQGIGQSWGKGGEATADDVEQFIEENPNMDERASDALRSTCTAAVQKIVIDAGSLQGARNPSSVILGRIRDAQKGTTDAKWKGAGKGKDSKGDWWSDGWSDGWDDDGWSSGGGMMDMMMGMMGMAMMTKAMGKKGKGKGEKSKGAEWSGESGKGWGSGKDEGKGGCWGAAKGGGKDQGKGVPVAWNGAQHQGNSSAELDGLKSSNPDARAQSRASVLSRLRGGVQGGGQPARSSPYENYGQ